MFVHAMLNRGVVEVRKNCIVTYYQFVGYFLQAWISKKQLGLLFVENRDHQHVVISCSHVPAVLGFQRDRGIPT
jgi:hypothetical protein